MPIYDIIIPGRGAYEVESKNDLTDAQAYQYALQQASKEGVSDALSRGAGIAARAMTPSAIGAAAGALGGPVVSAIGSMAVPAADALGSLINLIAGGAEKVSGVQMPRLKSTSQSIQDLMTMAGVPGAPETQNVPERIASAGLSAATGVATQVPSLMKAAATQATPAIQREVSRQMAVAPGVQTAVAPLSSMAAQGTFEATGDPLAAGAAGLTTAVLGGARTPRAERALSTSALEKVAQSKYQMLDESGLQLNNDAFVKSMTDIQKSLRSEGYTPKAFPKVTGALEELTSTAQPKDWTELQALRKMIKSGQASMDPDEKRIASILLDKYDDYLISVPKTDVIAGDAAKAGKIWDDARNAYSRMKKSEVFEDMLANAELDKSKFTQSGAENSLAQQLRTLAKNDKKMRLFTADERDAITKAAKGDTSQNLLKFFGRFAPTSAITGAFTGGISVLSPAIGIPLALGAAGSRVAATNQRIATIEDLANLMRAGQSTPMTYQQLIAKPTATTMRGLLSMPQLDEEQRNLMGIQ
jgi:hypothetical protein